MFRFFFLDLTYKLRKLTAGVLHKRLRRVILQDSSKRQDHDFVALDDRVQSVRDGEHGRVLELGLN